jgi:hypothetical protein
MKHMAVLIPILFFFLCTGCGRDTHESLTTKAVGTMKEMTALLEGVKDEASAKAAKPRLKSLIAQLEDLDKREKKLPAPTADEVKAMNEKFGPEMPEVQQKFMGQILRISFDPKLHAELADVTPQMKPAK